MKFIIQDQILEDNHALDWALGEGQYQTEEWIRDLATGIIEWLNNSDTITLSTSGSTGSPKNISHQKSAMQVSALKTAERFNLCRGMMSLNCLPNRYIAGKMMMIRAFVLDINQLCIAPRLALDTSYQGTIDFCAMTPMQLEQTLMERPELIAQIDQIIIGGAPVMPSLEAKLQSLSTKCYATYGMTETITHVATARLNGPIKDKTFEAINGVLFSIDDGNLVIEADHLEEGPFYTNDQVELIDSTHFRWLGRSDHIINSGGVKIHPEKIEYSLQSYIKDRFFIAGEEDHLSGQHVVLIIESRPYSSTKRLKLHSMLANLTKPERPVSIYYVPRLIETPTGKIIRKVNLYENRST